MLIALSCSFDCLFRNGIGTEEKVNFINGRWCCCCNNPITGLSVSPPPSVQLTNQRTLYLHSSAYHRSALSVCRLPCIWRCFFFSPFSEIKPNPRAEPSFVIWLQLSLFNFTLSNRSFVWQRKWRSRPPPTHGWREVMCLHRLISDSLSDWLADKPRNLYNHQ